MLEDATNNDWDDKRSNKQIQDFFLMKMMMQVKGTIRKMQKTMKTTLKQEFFPNQPLKCPII